MITFITGMPGAGKGIYSVLRTIEVLQTTDFPIISNFAYRPEPWVRRLGRRRSRGEKGFLAHLRDTFGKTFDLEKRLHVLTDEQMAEFYTWRVNLDGQLIQVPCVRDPKTQAVIELDKSVFTNTVPCYYLVDEAWKFWNARAWTKVAAGFQFYNAQHRKAGDNLDVTAQAASQLDKQLRVLVQEYHTLVNHGYRKIGLFRQPSMISVVVSNEPPEARSKAVGPLPKIIRFSKEEMAGIGSCFDTAAGAGVQGMGADIERKRKGLPFWLLPLLVIGLGLGFIGVCRGFGWGAGKLLTGGFESKPVKDLQKAMPQMASKASGVVGVPVAPAGGSASVSRALGLRGRLSSVDLEVGIVGWTDFPGVGARILLSDGRVLASGDIGMNSYDYKLGVVIYEGKSYRWWRRRVEYAAESETRSRGPVRPVGGLYPY